jgi:tetratricopeptide (TPR) repeat protein
MVLARYNRALIYSAKGALPEAVTDFTELIRVNPNVAELHTRRGMVYVKQHDFNHAVEDAYRDGRRGLAVTPIWEKTEPIELGIA